MSRSIIVPFALAIAASAGLAGLSIGTLAARQGDEPPNPDTPCPEKLGSSNALLCTCSAAQVKSGGTVWGDKIYTDDSSICRAARHAGVIPATGGVILVEEEFGKPSYPAVKRNGIASSKWGGWQRSIRFGNPSEWDMPASYQPPATTTSARFSYTEGELNVPQGNAAEGPCPANARAYKLGETHSCTCDEAASQGTAPVWGINPYTADSAICRAARHASVIGGGGGTVTFVMVKHEGGYKGSTKRNVITNSWGNYDLGFVF